MEQIIDRIDMDASIDVLLSKLPDVNQIDPASGLDLLSIVFNDSQLGYVPALLKHGADINRVDARGMTVWLCCVKKGNLPALEYLLELGANTALKNDQGQGTEYFAVANPVSTKCAKFLFAKKFLTPSATFQDLDVYHCSLRETSINLAKIELFTHILGMLDTITEERVESVREFLDIHKEDHGEDLSSQFTRTFESSLERIVAGGVMADNTSQVQSQPRRSARLACRLKQHT